MPQKYIDADGNEVETLTPEEAEKMKGELEEANKKLGDQTTELEKLQKKDFDWQKLENAKEKEREEMLSKLSDTERQMVEAQEKTNTQVASLQDQLESSWKTNQRGDVQLDEEQQKVFDGHYSQLMAGKEKTEENVRAAVKNALTLTNPQGGGQQTPNPINQGARTGGGGAPAPQEGDDKPLSDEKKSFAKDMGLSIGYDKPAEPNAGGGEGGG